MPKGAAFCHDRAMTAETDPAQFFAAHRDDVRRAALAGGGPAVVDYIEAFPTFGERLTLYTLARQVLVIGDGMPGGLDAIGEIADAAIAECEALLLEATDQREVQDLLRALHMLNFNLAADLADCWPDDQCATGDKPLRARAAGGELPAR